jgi:hypothetical protein
MRIPFLPIPSSSRLAGTGRLTSSITHIRTLRATPFSPRMGCSPHVFRDRSCSDRRRTSGSDGTRYAFLEGRRDRVGETFVYAFQMPAGFRDPPHSYTSESLP